MCRPCGLVVSRHSSIMTGTERLEHTFQYITVMNANAEIVIETVLTATPLYRSQTVNIDETETQKTRDHPRRSTWHQNGLFFASGIQRTS